MVKSGYHVGMIRTQVQFTEEQARRLRRKAAESGISVAALVRKAVDREVADGDQEVRWAHALRAVGSFHSGTGDIAEDHDRYLDEAYGAW